MARKIGDSADEKTRDTWPLSKLLGQFRQFIRTDYGGSDVKETTKSNVGKFADERGVQLSEAGLDLVADFAIEFSKHHLDGSRKRIENPLGGIERRVNRLSYRLEQAVAKLSAAGVAPEIIAEITSAHDEFIKGNSQPIKELF